MRVAILLTSLALCSCGKISADLPTTPEQEKVSQIGEKCGVSRKVLVWENGTKLALRLSPTEKPENVECLLAELKNADIPVKNGFIGTEISKTEGDNAQSR